jgi:hypothetical protein
MATNRSQVLRKRYHLLRPATDIISMIAIISLRQGGDESQTALSQCGKDLR